MKGTSHACISASYIGKEEENESGQKERIGILNRFKTQKGCEGEECELTQRIRQEYCPNMKLWLPSGSIRIDPSSFYITYNN